MTPVCIRPGARSRKDSEHSIRSACGCEHIRGKVLEQTIVNNKGKFYTQGDAHIPLSEPQAAARGVVVACSSDDSALAAQAIH